MLVHKKFCSHISFDYILEQLYMILWWERFVKLVIKSLINNKMSMHLINIFIIYDRCYLSKRI